MTAVLHQLEVPMRSRESVLIHRPARGRLGLPCWLVLPSRTAPDAVPLIAVHGIQRGAYEKASLLRERAEALGRPLIAPLFDRQTWPHYQQLVRKGRADLALLALLEELRMEGIWQTTQFDLFGHSGGAQFSHRFAMLYPHLVRRLIVGAAGWYTFPDAAEFPLGLAARQDKRDDWGPKMEAGLNRFLRLPIQVYVGEHDCKPDENTRSGPAIDRQQGPDRLTRARRWSHAVREAAEARGLRPDIDLQVLRGCTHLFSDCVARGELTDLVLPEPDAVASSETRFA
ncbi:alpha/beta fold hydrolase [Algihabitans sp.]|uniref:alpha/beta fold hydrolase n=1 Tax=Algihabitans sp. TaxID=2821514 RepID=UPI003BAAE1AB